MKENKIYFELELCRKISAKCSPTDTTIWKIGLT